MDADFCGFSGVFMLFLNKRQLGIKQNIREFAKFEGKPTHNEDEKNDNADDGGSADNECGGGTGTEAAR